MSLNVNGLLSKLKFNDFLDYLCTFDLIRLSETKLDNYDDFNLENFSIFSKNRQKYRSGGVLLVKNNISKYIEIIPSECNNILWFSINQKLLGFFFLVTQTREPALNLILLLQIHLLLVMLMWIASQTSQTQQTSLSSTDFP